MHERILVYLRTHRGQHCASDDIAQALTTSAMAVAHGVAQLRAIGYEIEDQPHLGYRLVRTPDRMIDYEIRAGLRTAQFGRALQCFDETDSTMDVAHQWAVAGAPDGALVCAERQRHGRGRAGRTWVSPRGTGVYASLIVRPSLPVRAVPVVTLTMAVGLVRALNAWMATPVRIKWPNDLMVGQAKLGGVLTELGADQESLRYIIIGFGVNINTPAEALPPEATSVSQVLGHAVDRLGLMRDMLFALEQVYQQLCQDGFESLRAEWRQHTNTLGQRVRIITEPSVSDQRTACIEGQALDIDADGALVLRHDSGTQERVIAGDVHTIG